MHSPRPPLLLRHRLLKPWVAWLACVAILLNAWAPALSQALAVARGDMSGLLAVCSAGTAGLGASAASTPLTTRLASANPGRSKSPAQPASKPAAHCPFCLTHAGSVGLPPAAAPAVVALLPDTGKLTPPLFLHAPSPLFAWRPGQARAPPLV